MDVFRVHPFTRLYRHPTNEAYGLDIMEPERQNAHSACAGWAFRIWERAVIRVVGRCIQRSFTTPG